jgi:hypothetical protein
LTSNEVKSGVHEGSTEEKGAALKLLQEQGRAEATKVRNGLTWRLTTVSTTASAATSAEGGKHE